MKLDVKEGPWWQDNMRQNGNIFQDRTQYYPDHGCVYNAVYNGAFTIVGLPGQTVFRRQGTETAP